MGTKVTIGGKEYELPPLNFKALKTSFPFIQRVINSQAAGKGAQDVEGAVLAMDAAVNIIASAMAKPYPDMTKERIEDELLASEITGLTSSIHQLLLDSGLVKQASGKSPAVGDQKANPSTAISTESSASLSPPAAKAEAGTE